MRRVGISFLLIVICWAPKLWGQTALLSKGKWVKIGTTKQGIYKLNGGQLQTMGFTLPVSSNKIQIFGFDLDSLTEKVPQNPTIGLLESAIEVQDGGDGQVDEKDNILFYAPGTIAWKWDELAQQYVHQKLTNGDTLYYFVTIGENGKRISKNTNQGLAQKTIINYTSHLLFETDTINLLNSGKDWFGLPMGIGTGKIATISYPLNLSNIIWNEPIQFNTKYAASSYQIAGVFDLKINDIKLKSTIVNPVSGIVYDAAANLVVDNFSAVLNKSDFGNALNSVNLNVNYTGSSNSTGWIDFIELHAKSNLDFAFAKAFGFNATNENSNASIFQYNISGADSSVIVWNVTNAFTPIAIPLTIQNSMANFKDNILKSQAYFTLKQLAYETPTFSANIPNQDLASFPETDYIIIAAPDFENAAKKLQQFHITKHGYKVGVLNSTTIFNEFSGGQAAPIAIRNFIKYLQNRANSNGYKAPQYLLLLGMGNFNTRKINLTSQIPSFESAASNEILNTYSSDDFYAIIQTGDDINYPNSIKKLGIAVGRLPAKNAAEADTTITKIINYQSGNNRGAWQNQITWIADDGDYNLHLQDAESISQNLKLKAPNWNQQKYYLDLYPAVASSTGPTYPLANNDIKQAVNNGTLILNYTGHGNYLRLAEEAVVSEKEIAQWNNSNTLPLFITASCDFAPFDQPQLSPIGFQALMQNKNGVVGLVSASRLVFAYSNKQINDLYIQQLLVPQQNGLFPTIGQALINAKMENWAQNGDHLNAFKFNLMGDPALSLLKPNLKVELSQINQKLFTRKDSLETGVKTNLIGKVVSGGMLQSDFTGLVDFILFDAVQEKSTLGNQSNSIVTKIKTQETVLYRGKATVNKGVFSIDFVLPVELSSQSGPLRMQWYAYNANNDALGICDSIYVKNSVNDLSLDKQGPIIKTFVSDTNFISGGWVNANSNLLVHLKDTSGIQSSGHSLGHDLQLIIDNDFKSPIVLNNYYSTVTNKYDEGWIKYSLPILSEGKHELIIKAWDLLGNGSRDTIYVEVPNTNKLMANHLINAPNPFTNQTRFSFDVNITSEPIQCTLQLYDSKGTPIFEKKLASRYVSSKLVLDWDGLNSGGAAIEPGLYFYKIILNNGKEVVVLSNKLIKL
jgi:hypothetical protein